ncbi:putative oxidoreductase [Saccharomyces paradoxus]|uniref:Oxidoreductase n=1 Tax=Saccharomyces paradoxus TaxID=27291 RepID=A0A8B8UPN0_SACPA|nr:Gmc1 [Saccharomyces paradoxus]QHS72681.1 Gmc1 [Saccharomyces paradoxus]
MKSILLKLVQIPMLMLILFKFIKGSEEGKIHVLEFNVTSEYTSDKRRFISINGYNGTFGPEIRVKSGDTLNLRLINWICSEEEAGKDNVVWKDYCSTALHFHGVVPLSNRFDGIPDLTQPIIGYGESYWYNFTIDRSTCGTFWYHSHSSVQYGDGLRGVLIIECDDYDNHVENTVNSVSDVETLIDGIVTMKKKKSTKELSKHEVEEKIITLSDWYTNWNLDTLKDKVLSLTGGTDPKLDGSLINGKPSDGEGIKLGLNAKYLLLRIINAGMSGTQVFHLEGFQLIVLETDGIMIKPFIVQTLTLAAGQRYTVLVKLKTDTNPIRMINGCNKMMGYITKQWWFYKEGLHLDLSKNPSDVSIKHLPGFTKTELYRDLEPTQEENKKLRIKTDPVAVFEFDYAYYKDDDTKRKYGTGMYKVNNRTFSEYLKEPVSFSEYNETYEVIINSLDHMRHPWHMHGHHFQVISLGTNGDGPLHRNVQEGEAWTQYQKDLRHWARTGKAPMVRDSINIAGNSYAVLRIRTELPGKWLLHCHVEWHMMKGLGIVFEVPATTTDGTKQATTAILQYPTKEPNPTTVVHPAVLHQNKSKVITIYILIMCAIDGVFYWLLM